MTWGDVTGGPRSLPRREGPPSTRHRDEVVDAAGHEWAACLEGYLLERLCAEAGTREGRGAREGFAAQKPFGSSRSKMALLFAGWWSELYFVVLSCLFFYYVYFKVFSSQFWKKKNVVHLEPVFILGNTWQASITKNFAFILFDIYSKWKDQKVVGFWNFTKPMLLVNDLDIVKNVLTRDFSHFRDRGFEIDFERDPLAGNLFNVGGAKWRNLRVKLTPTFTSGKMKMMFPTMAECGEELQRYLEKVAEEKREVEVKEILARFTTDIISSCAFGIQTDSLKNPNSEFRHYGKKIFQPTLSSIVRGIVINTSPFIFKVLKMRFTPEDVSEFFLKAVKDTMEYRETKDVKRNDFMQLLIQLKNKGKLEDVDGVVQASPDDEAKSTEELKFTFNEAAAQAFVFFAAGFETSSTTLSYALYELALDSEIQTKLQEEIDRTLEKYGNKMSYEAVNEMEYLDRVIQETLRKYPPVPMLFRQCNKEYEIPELNVVIPKGTVAMISVLGIQRDPLIFVNPERFDPQRFSPEEKDKRHPFAHLPFGEGPRNCIGNRFGLLQTKVGLVSILSKFKVEVAKETPVPLKFDKRSFVLAVESGMPLKLVKRT